MRTHGRSGTGAHRTWKAMCQRARQTEGKYAHVDICERWTGPEGFANFYADMGERPTGMSIHRIDNSLGYSPENCRWATAHEQRMGQRWPTKRVGKPLTAAHRAAISLGRRRQLGGFVVAGLLALPATAGAWVPGNQGGGVDAGCHGNPHHIGNERGNPHDVGGSNPHECGAPQPQPPHVCPPPPPTVPPCPCATIPPPVVTITVVHPHKPHHKKHKKHKKHHHVFHPHPNPSIFAG